MPIVFDNVSYTYSPKSSFRKEALKEVSLTIEDGDFFGIIGHTGSGKSTLVSHINGLTKLQSGKLTVGEFDLSRRKIKYKQLRAYAGMVFQYPEHQLFDESVAKDVGFGPRNLKLDKDEIDKRVRRAIELVGLDYKEIADKSPFDISGGQKRRVALAGVIAMEPKVLILDEPTAGLDPSGKKEIMALINNLKKTCPTIIMVSHNMDEIAANCNRIAVLNGGRLEYVLPPKELFRNYDRLKELRLDVPSATKVAGMLADKGWDIDRGIYCMGELADRIASEVKGKEI
ncbi:MAG: energy-coupling factor transporter ATPase [Firmicutes bacterium]|nr:energy-coupling factor transporter ATPase [Bacillota bacterium]